MTSGYDIPAAFADHLRIGTCSWKYDSWKGLVYDPDRRYRPDDYLPDYARHFTTVEIDQWFWSLFPTGVRLPDPAAVKRYAESVPDDFRFTIKAPNAITLTHSYAKGPQRQANETNPHFLSADLLNRFLETLEPMHGKLRPVMFQFEYLNKQKIAEGRGHRHVGGTRQEQHAGIRVCLMWGSEANQSSSMAVPAR